MSMSFEREKATILNVQETLEYTQWARRGAS